MSDQKVNRLTKTCLHVEELNIFISNLGKDLLNLKRIQIFICFLQTFFQCLGSRCSYVQITWLSRQFLDL